MAVCVASPGTLGEDRLTHSTSDKFKWGFFLFLLLLRYYLTFGFLFGYFKTILSTGIFQSKTIFTMAFAHGATL